LNVGTLHAPFNMHAPQAQLVVHVSFARVEFVQFTPEYVQVRVAPFTQVKVSSDDPSPSSSQPLQTSGPLHVLNVQVVGEHAFSPIVPHEVVHGGLAKVGLHPSPLYASPSQSWSSASHCSGCGPTPLHAPHVPFVWHVCVPFTHSPTSLPQGCVAPLMQEHPGSGMPSQSLSLPSHVSVCGVTWPKQGPHVPLASQVDKPAVHGPTPRVAGGPV
jgi:hypothetical protein